MILAPSILSADFGRLAEQVQLAEKGGAGAVHVDVMDGHFVPNLTVGPAVVKAVRKATALPIDVHLMIENAERYVDVFVDAGATWVSLHVEAMPHLQRTVAHLRARGVKTAAAVNPGTSLTVLDEILPELDYVVVMSVNPGFSGQAFIPSSVDKVRRLRAQLTRLGLPLRIEVDGGVDRTNARTLVEAGADVLVAGNAVFASGDPEGAARALVEAAR
jgi:ribulose-phosphate 3-epimerase